MRKKWTYKEICFLKEHYGSKSLCWIAKQLGRSVGALLNKKGRLHLGAYTDYADEYITFNQLAILLDINQSYTKKLLDANFPLKRIKRVEDYVKVVNLKSFYKWIEKGNNKHLVDFSKTVKGDFGAIEPKWFEEKRKADKLYKQYKQTQWTEEENKRLISLLKEYKYSYPEISKKLMRLETAIKRQFTVLKIPYRPLKADNHNMWKPEEIELVKSLYKKGYKSIVIRDYLKDRSQLAINGLLERHNYFL